MFILRRQRSMATISQEDIAADLTSTSLLISSGDKMYDIEGNIIDSYKGKFLLADPHNGIVFGEFNTYKSAEHALDYIYTEIAAGHHACTVPEDK